MELLCILQAPTPGLKKTVYSGCFLFAVNKFKGVFKSKFYERTRSSISKIFKIPLLIVVKYGNVFSVRSQLTLDTNY